mgnify:CR=1 FL=1
MAIGSSTGGVEALLTVLGGFPADCPATVVTQHMPATFTASFAARLDRVCAPTVTEAQEGAPLQPGHVYIAPGGVAHLEVASGLTPRCRLTAGEPVNGHRPSVDVMFQSVAGLGRPMTGVILTGMGQDGRKGCEAVKSHGGVVVAQDEASSLVWGMPRAVITANLHDAVVPLSRIAGLINESCSRTKEKK